VSNQIDRIDQLICDCLGRASDADLAGELQKLPGTDWRDLLVHSNDHLLTPLIHRRLKALGSISPEHMEPFRRAYLLTARSNSLAFYEFTRIFTTFQQATLPVIVLKGAYLAENIYHNIAVRPLGDLDLVFQRSDLERALALVETLGYSNRAYSLDAEQELSQELATPHTRPNTVDIDFHWGLEALSSGFTIDMDGVWQRSIPVKIANVEVRCLCPEDLLLYQCLHGSYHHQFQGGLRGLADIREVIIALDDQIDWQVFTQRAHSWGIQRPAYFALRLTSELTGISIPGRVLDALFSGEIPDDLYHAAMRNLFTPDESPTRMTILLARMLNAKTPLQKLRYWVEAAFPSRKVMARKYPIDPNSPMIWFYYPVRVFDLVLKYGMSALRNVRGEHNMVQSSQAMHERNELSDWMSGKIDCN
jgi:hypothetical protein